jgi:hypothetical protein
MQPGAKRTMLPLVAMTVSATPSVRAKRACSLMWRNSPWMGMVIFGFTQPYMAAKSSFAGWPETCTK